MCTGAAAPGQRSTSARTFFLKEHCHGEHRDTKKIRLQAGSEPCCLWFSVEDSGYCRLLFDSPKASNDSALDYIVPCTLLRLRCAEIGLTVLNVERRAYSTSFGRRFLCRSS